MNSSNTSQTPISVNVRFRSLGLLVLVVSLVLGNASSAIAGLLHARVRLFPGITNSFAGHSGVAHAERHRGSKYCIAHETKGFNYIRCNAGDGHAEHHGSGLLRSNGLFMPTGDIRQENSTQLDPETEPPVLGSPGTSLNVSQTWLPNAEGDRIIVTWSPDNFLQVDPSDITPGTPLIVRASLTADGGLAGTVELSARLDSVGSVLIETQRIGIFEGASFQLVTHPNGVRSMQFQQLLTWDVPGIADTFVISLDSAINLLPTSQPPVSDFDGDGKSDISVYRPSSGIWYIQNSSNSSLTGSVFGAPGDILAPGDYDGDARADLAVFRASSGSWYVMQSTEGFRGQVFGQNGDIPVSGDYDGDSRTDIAVYRPSTGVFYIMRSTEGFTSVQFGVNSDKPAVGDYDGDGKADVAVYRPSSGFWYIQRSSAGFAAFNFGTSGDVAAQGDYDCDGKTDLAVYRPFSGQWYLMNSQTGFNVIQFGLNGDHPAPGDFDGDGKTDVALFRPSTGGWYVLRSQEGFLGQQFGVTGDLPIPSAYIGQ